MELPPLGPDPRAIRLLKVRRDARQGYISCVSHHYTLSEPDTDPILSLRHIFSESEPYPISYNPISYVALSYVWGTESNTLRILLNDTPLMIRPNLYLFLQYVTSARDQFARELRDSFLWIDALCIDQQSNDDKDKQVPLMGLIFSEARFVIGWLWSATSAMGSDDPNSQAVRSLVAEIAKDRQDVNLADYSSYYHSNHDAELQAWFKARARLEERAEDGMFSAALIRLTEHAYWSRLWVVQEIDLAQHLLILWEGEIVPWPKLQHFLHVIAKWTFDELDYGRKTSFADRYQQEQGRSWRDLPVWNFVDQKVLPPVTYMDSTRKSRSSLRDLIFRFANHNCMILHDRVYAMLALASDARAFEVNHSESTLCLVMRVLDNHKMNHRPNFDDWSATRRICEMLQVDPNPEIVLPFVTGFDYCGQWIKDEEDEAQSLLLQARTRATLCEACFSTSPFFKESWQTLHDLGMTELPPTSDVHVLFAIRKGSPDWKYGMLHSQPIYPKFLAIRRTHTTSHGTTWKLHTDC